MHTPSADERVGKGNKKHESRSPCHRKNEAGQSGLLGRLLLYTHCDPDGCSLRLAPSVSPMVRTKTEKHGSASCASSHSLSRIRKACQINLMEHQPHSESVQPNPGRRSQQGRKPALQNERDRMGLLHKNIFARPDWTRSLEVSPLSSAFCFCTFLRNL